MDEALEVIRWIISGNYKICSESPLGEKICERARFCQDLIPLYQKYKYPELLKLIHTYIIELEKLIDSVKDKKLKKLTLKSLNKAKDELLSIYL